MILKKQLFAFVFISLVFFFLKKKQPTKMVCSGSLCGPTSHRDGEASALNQQLHSCARVHAVEGPDKTCMARLFVRPLILGSASPRSLAVTSRTSPERLLPYLGEASHGMVALTGGQL